MDIPWGIIISLVVVIVALVLGVIFFETIEDTRVMQIVVGSFMVLFVLAAFLVGWLSPAIPGNEVHLAAVTQFLQLTR